MKSRRRFYLTFGVSIALTGVVTFLSASVVIRPIMLRHLEPRLVEEVIEPVARETLAQSTGQPVGRIQIDSVPGQAWITAEQPDGLK
ncbi:MAG: hypothetical protein AAFQ82_18855, partial [Myxococcota bacterium]